MIPLEKLISIEAKAREYGYSTTITNGGQFDKYKNGKIVVYYDGIELKLRYPGTEKFTIEEFKETIEDQKQLLELALMLQKNTIEDDVEEDDKL